MIWSALILAGSRGASDPVAEAAGVPHKAFAEVAGRPMIAWVSDALAACSEIGQIAVCAPSDLSVLPELRRISTGPSPAASVLKGIDTLGSPMLITTADNPLLSTATVNDFLAKTEANTADVTAGLAPRRVVDQAGNPGRRTYLKFRDGAYSGCNLFAVARPEGRAAIDFWCNVEADRKQPWRMAGKIGLTTLGLYLAGRLTLDGAVGAVAKRAGCRAAAIRLDDPYAAHDVDKPEDLAFAERVLTQRLATAGRLIDG